jgi:hypothetical protein
MQSIDVVHDDATSLFSLPPCLVSWRLSKEITTNRTNLSWFRAGFYSWRKLSETLAPALFWHGWLAENFWTISDCTFFRSFHSWNFQSLQFGHHCWLLFDDAKFQKICRIWYVFYVVISKACGRYSSKKIPCLYLSVTIFSELNRATWSLPTPSSPSPRFQQMELSHLLAMYV